MSTTVIIILTIVAAVGAAILRFAYVFDSVANDADAGPTELEE